MAGKTEVVDVSAEEEYEKTTEPRPLHEFQADLSQFLDAASRTQGVAVTVPYGTVYLKQPAHGVQGREFDVLIANENDAFCWRGLLDRSEVRRLIEGAEYHTTRVARGPYEEIWPQRIVARREIA